MPKLDPSTNIASDYLQQVFTDLAAVVNRSVKKLSLDPDRFEGIAVRGTSGLLVGPQVASLLRKPWCVIRKPGDGTHSDHKTVEGWFGFKTYIIVDDLVSSGSTLKFIQSTLQNHFRGNPYNWERGCPECVGYYLYNHDELVWRGDGKNYAYQDKYFLFPEKPLVSEQIAAAIGQRPLLAENNY